MTRQQAFRRFPALRDRFNSVVVNFFKNSMAPTTKLVSDMVAYVPILISAHTHSLMVYTAQDASVLCEYDTPGLPQRPQGNGACH